MNEIEITINNIAQDLIDINSGIRWFEEQDSSEKKKPIKEALFQIENLPQNEWIKAFTLGINIFFQSDSRRRETDCKNGCYHEWHRLAGL